MAQTFLRTPFHHEATQLLTDSLNDHWGAMSVSFYDTSYAARLERALRPPGSLTLLLDNQARDGSWGGPDLYAFVPTLAATATLLHLLVYDATLTEIEMRRIAHSARRGLHYITTTAVADVSDLPDTVAVELIVPALIADIGENQTRLRARLTDAHDSTLHGCVGTNLPHLDSTQLRGLRARIEEGTDVPVQVGHSLEVLGDAVASIGLPSTNGVYGCSPAATAWMIANDAANDPRSLPYLHSMAARLSGGQPNVAPITWFERGWILALFAQSRMMLPPALVARMIVEFKTALTPMGIAGGAGLPPDGDDTGMVYALLNMFDVAHEPVPILTFEGTNAFRCFAGERTTSPSVNAHLLDGLTTFLGRSPSASATYRQAAIKIALYLLAAQHPDGYWTDKWHASPYYGTYCVVLALHRLVGSIVLRETDRIAIRNACERARVWVVNTLHTSGGWGRWHATLEETAYALYILDSGDSPHESQVSAQGAAYMLANRHAPASNPVRLPLWHGKELYRPDRIVEAAILGALHLRHAPSAQPIHIHEGFTYAH